MEEVVSNVCPYFSVIIATRDRPSELYALLTSLSRGTFKDLEVIVVSQGKKITYGSIPEEISNNTTLIHMTHVGLSRARNIGLRYAKGEICYFPDDDALIPPDMLQYVYDWFLKHPTYDGLIGSFSDTMQPNPRHDKAPGEINLLNLWRRHSSTALFLKRKIFDNINGFDELLGLGAPFPAAEETDLIIRALLQGFRLYYDPSLVVFHKLKTSDSMRVYGHALAEGALLSKHLFHHPAFVYIGLRRFAGAVIKLVISGFSETARKILVGRAHGLLKYSWMKLRRSI